MPTPAARMIRRGWQPRPTNSANGFHRHPNGRDSLAMAQIAQKGAKAGSRLAAQPPPHPSTTLRASLIPLARPKGPPRRQSLAAPQGGRWGCERFRRSRLESVRQPHKFAPHSQGLGADSFGLTTRRVKAMASQRPREARARWMSQFANCTVALGFKAMNLSDGKAREITWITS